MAKDCKNNIPTCPDPISVNCVLWDGTELDCYDSCPAPITNIIKSVADDTCKLLGDVNLDEVNLTQDFINLLGDKDKSIANLFQVLLNYNTTLKNVIEQVNGITISDGSASSPEEAPITYVLDFKCMDTNLDPCNPLNLSNLQDILQVIINAFCNLQTQLDTVLEGIQETVEETIADYFNNLISSPLPNRVISQSTGTNYKLLGLIPPHVPVPYFGPLNDFDATGKGINIMEGWYLSNGLNGTVDMRGFTTIGAMAGVVGPAYDQIVEPIANMYAPYVSGDKGGKVKVLLTLNEMPGHTHSAIVNDPGHTHTYTNFPNVGNIGQGGTSASSNKVETSYTTSNSKTGITVQIGAAGKSFAHENRMPFKAGVYIQMIN